MLLANTQWRSLSVIVLIDPKDGRASQLSPRDGAAWTLLDNNNGGRLRMHGHLHSLPTRDDCSVVVCHAFGPVL